MVGAPVSDRPKPRDDWSTADGLCHPGPQGVAQPHPGQHGDAVLRPPQRAGPDRCGTGDGTDQGRRGTGHLAAGIGTVLRCAGGFTLRQGAYAAVLVVPPEQCSQWMPGGAPNLAMAREPDRQVAFGPTSKRRSPTASWLSYLQRQSALRFNLLEVYGYPSPCNDDALPGSSGSTSGCIC